MLKPLRDYVVLEKAKEEEKTKSGIILTEQPKEEPGKGIVVAVGPGKTENGAVIPVELKVGQKVVYKKYSGTEIKEKMCIRDSMADSQIVERN